MNQEQDLELMEATLEALKGRLRLAELQAKRSRDRDAASIAKLEADIAKLKEESGL